MHVFDFDELLVALFLDRYGVSFNVGERAECIGDAGVFVGDRADLEAIGEEFGPDIGKIELIFDADIEGRFGVGSEDW